MKTEINSIFNAMVQINKIPIQCLFKKVGVFICLKIMAHSFS